MNVLKLFFMLLEIGTPLFGLYIVLTKKELAVIYLPPLLFAQLIVTLAPMLPAFLAYLLFSAIILFLIIYNLNFFRYNIFSLLLILWIFFLMQNVTDLVAIRPFLFAVIWLFLLIPLISSIYEKHAGNLVFNEMAKSSLLLLTIFILNVILSSFAGYAPYAMYGITSGILYGNLYATDFNVLPLALFVVLIKVMHERKIIYFLVFAVSLAFILLSLRRSVMGLSLLGIAVVLYIFLTPRNFKTIAAFIVFIGVIGSVIVYNTNFIQIFEERYELRNLDDRELKEEKRFLEYELLYKDMFVYQEYNPWLGYGLFDSGGNYGKGVLGNRTLHADLTNITHSMGFIGLGLYLMMMVWALCQGFRHSRKRIEWATLVFCSIIFLVYTITGRYTNIATFIFLMLLVNLPRTLEFSAKREKLPPQVQNQKVRKLSV
ncbi:O-antigen ligase family protein [Negadavirga shengliensis]|uniref:O-antigen ligase family protein n=1 Tax=Negadavirga shengliensis TaxID=1389218 RepID=A0ABV9T313_9BACT